MPMTPIGAMKIGVGSFLPNSSIDKSRREPSTIIRGTRPHFANAATFRSCVRSSPQPPWTYETSTSGQASMAFCSRIAISMGSLGTMPLNPAA